MNSEHSKAAQNLYEVNNLKRPRKVDQRRKRLRELVIQGLRNGLLRGKLGPLDPAGQPGEIELDATPIIRKRGECVETRRLRKAGMTVTIVRQKSGWFRVELPDEALTDLLTAEIKTADYVNLSRRASRKARGLSGGKLLRSTAEESEKSLSEDVLNLHADRRRGGVFR